MCLAEKKISIKFNNNMNENKLMQDNMWQKLICKQRINLIQRENE